MLWLVVPVVGTLFPLYIHFLMRGRQGATRVSMVLAGTALALTGPWYIPADMPWLRFFTGMGSLLAMCRLIEVAYERFPDPQMQRGGYGRFLYYYLNSHDALWPASTRERQQVRAQGRRRLARAVLKWVSFLGLLAVSSLQPSLHEQWFLHLFWTAWITYFYVTAGFDTESGLAMQSGIGLSEAFAAPFSADSPRDFWSRRWNLIFRNIAHRLVFVPWRGKDRPVRVVALVFAISALAHEYLVVASLGVTRGDMTIFFALHWAATLGHGMLSRKRQGRPLMPRPLAIFLHLIWFTVTSHFFFTPFEQIFPVHLWRLF